MALDARTRLSLIHGIFAEPGEDAPRLVYADWLADHGDDVLADLIRLQLEMSRPWTSRTRLHDLRRRERELLDALGPWRALSCADPVTTAYSGPPAGWSYTLVEGVPRLYVMSGADGRLDFPPREWVERFGWFTVLLGEFYCRVNEPSGFVTTVSELRRLLEWPLIDRCIGLDMAEILRFHGDCDTLLANWPGAARLLRLGGFAGALTSPLLAGLVSVSLRQEQIEEETVAALAAMPGLRHLRVRHSHFAPGVVAALAKLSRLRSLDLSGYGNLVDRDAHELASGALHDLVELNLEGTRVCDDGALALIRSPHLPHLHRLLLSGSSIGARAVEGLCETDRFLRCGALRLHGREQAQMLEVVTQSPHAAHLRYLETGGIDTGTALALASSPHLKGLVKLSLGFGHVGPEGAEALIESLPSLEELRIQNNPIGDRGALTLGRLARSKGEPCLDLWKNGVTAAGVAALIESGCLAGLSGLQLNYNPIGDAGVAALAGCRDLAGLDWLGLSGVGVTDEGALALANSPHLPRQVSLALECSGLGKQTKAALRERFPRAYGYDLDDYEY